MISKTDELQKTKEKLINLFGDSSITDAESPQESYVEEGIKTGCLSWDIAIGRTGIPAGRVITIAGEEASGKSGLAIELIKQAVQGNITPIVIDTEQAYDKQRFKDMGIDQSRVLFMKADFLEDYFDKISKVIDALDSNDRVLFVIDSLAGVTPKNEYEGDFDDEFPAAHARVMSRAFRKIIPKICKAYPNQVGQKKKVTLLFVNQLKTNIKMLPFQKGGLLKHFGGKALMYHSTLIFVLDQPKILKDKQENAKAISVRLTVAKNKVADPYKEAIIRLNFSRGVDRYRDLFETGLKLGLIKKKGSRYSYKNQSDSFYQNDFKSVVDDKLGGCDKVYRQMQKWCIESGLIMPYELEKNEVIVKKANGKNIKNFIKSRNGRKRHGNKKKS
jgi:recombination protein RecA